ncbi:hypothetical protein O1L55_39445 [Streptomyces albulus]|nr:hypothetical protein [Streptomyces noursei]
MLPRLRHHRGRQGRPSAHRRGATHRYRGPVDDRPVRAHRHRRQPRRRLPDHHAQPRRGRHRERGVAGLRPPRPAHPHPLGRLAADGDAGQSQRRPAADRPGPRPPRHRRTGRVPPHRRPGLRPAGAPRLVGGLARHGRRRALRVLRLLRSPAGRERFDLGSELLLTRISRARQRLDTVHALLQQSLRTLESGADLSVPARQLQLNALKITAAEECHAAVDDLVTALGLRHGYLQDSPTGLERALRDLRSAALNYSNDRLHLADGRLALRDQGVTFA